MTPFEQLPSDLAETHISTVVFVGDRAYKWLKPVRTGFLDHRDVEARLAAIDRELELNRRLAPDVYLATADIVEDGELVDRVLVMRRLPHDRRLSALVGTDEFEPALRSVARAIAAFHARLEPCTDATGMATSEGLAALWESSFEEIESAAGRDIDREEFEAVRGLARRYLEHNSALFDSRREAGMVRDGHGDLTAEDVFILEDGPRVLDCLAFDDGLRICDVLADIGFLVMDVHRLAGADLARRLMHWYMEFSGERHPSSLAHHYVAYRAHVRAKVELIRTRQGVAAAAPVARAYHELAHDHLRRAQLRMVLVGGGPGSGKTTLAQAIADRTGWLVLGSDEIRKDLCGVPHDEHRDHDPWTGMYDLATTEHTYETLIDQAAAALHAGESVILDASWTAQRHRDQARETAAAVGADLCELQCRVSREIARTRVEDRRVVGADPSDAVPDIVDHMAARWEEWTSSDPVETDGSLEESVRQAFTHLLRCWGPDATHQGVSR